MGLLEKSAFFGNFRGRYPDLEVMDLPWSSITQNIM